MSRGNAFSQGGEKARRPEENLFFFIFFCLMKFRAVVAKTEASRCSSGRRQGAAGTINSVRSGPRHHQSAGGRGRAGSSHRAGDATEGEDRAIRGLEAPCAILAFIFVSYTSPPGCFPLSQSFFSPRRSLPQVPGAQRLCQECMEAASALPSELLLKSSVSWWAPRLGTTAPCSYA